MIALREERKVDRRTEPSDDVRDRIGVAVARRDTGMRRSRRFPDDPIAVTSGWIVLRQTTGTAGCDRTGQGRCC